MTGPLQPEVLPFTWQTLGDDDRFSFRGSVLSPPPDVDVIECSLQFPDDDYSWWDLFVKLCVFVFAFVIPVLIIIVCYTLMILRLKSVRLLSGSREKDRNLRRITRLVLVVVAVFVVCWTPIHIFILVEALGSTSHSTAALSSYYFCIALGYTNSSLNPILYAFLDENFKRCFRDFCFPVKVRMERQSTSRIKNTVQDPAYMRDADGINKPVWLVVEMSSYSSPGREVFNDLGSTQITTAVWAWKGRNFNKLLETPWSEVIRCRLHSDPGEWKHRGCRNVARKLWAGRCSPFLGWASEADSQFLCWTQKQVSISRWLDIGQDPSAETFLCNMVSKALVSKKEKNNKVASELIGHAVQMLITDSSNLKKKENHFQGPRPAHFMLRGRTFPAAAWWGFQHKTCTPQVSAVHGQ